MIDRDAYTLRISQAGPAQLVVINFELIVDFLNAALEGSACPETFSANTQKAKSGLEQLIQSLDFKVNLAHDFYAIYNYAYGRLCEASFTSDDEKAKGAAREVKELMEMLLAGWREAAEKTEDEPADGAPKVYAGLTYGRDGQAEEYIADDEKKGFMA